MMSAPKIKEYLDSLEKRYNQVYFIASDPVSIPHLFSKREDVEISAFLVSVIAWGQRAQILKNGRSLVERMGMSPHDFVLNASQTQVRQASAGFVHRTFNDEDFERFILALRRIYTHHGGLGGFFEDNFARNGDLRVALADFRAIFVDSSMPARSARHVSSIAKGSACKRLCMMLRWMVRDDENGVDFGLWTRIPASALYIPLDVHSARQGRALGLLSRKQDDWRAVEELTAVLRGFDSSDPAKYDFALFGVGVNGESLLDTI